MQLHRDVIAVLDQEAARLLERRDYYRQMEEAQARLQMARHEAPAGDPRSAQLNFTTMHCVVGSSISGSGLSFRNFAKASRTPDRIE